MNYREILKEARDLYTKAAASTDPAEIEDLVAQAEVAEQRADAAKKAEGIVDEAPVTDGVPTTQAQAIREGLLSAGVAPGVADATIKAMGGNGAGSAPFSRGDDGGKSFRDFLGCIRYGNRSRLRNVYGSKYDAEAFEGIKASFPWMKDLEESSGATGGYTVPTEMLVDELLMVEMGEAVVRPLARSFPMSSRSLTIPMLDQGDQPAEYWKLDYFGGVLSYWTEEGGAKTETEPGFKQLELVAHKLAGYTQASDELLADSPLGIENLLVSLFRGAISTREDFGFLRGTGVGMPLGVLNSTVLLTQNRATANTIEYRDLMRMLDDFMPGSFPNAVWCISHTALPTVLQMEDTAGNNVFVPNATGGVTQPMPGTLLGRPIIITEKLPTIGNTGDVLLADFSYYIIGDRLNTAINSSIHYDFINDLTTWRFVHRVDGQPWLDEPVYIDTANQVSPFVALHANTTS